MIEILLCNDWLSQRLFSRSTLLRSVGLLYMEHLSVVDISPKATLIIGCDTSCDTKIIDGIIEGCQQGLMFVICSTFYIQYNHLEWKKSKRLEHILFVIS